MVLGELRQLRAQKMMQGRLPGGGALCLADTRKKRHQLGEGSEKGCSGHHVQRPEGGGAAPVGGAVEF